MLTVHTLASGSSGNAALVTDGETSLLIDAGISARRISQSLARLGLAPGSLDGVLITHEHTDHIAGLTTLTKQCRLPVYTTAGTGRQLCWRIPFLDDLVRPVVPGEELEIGSFRVRPFATSHDAAASAGFRLTCPAGTAAVATDLGVLTPEVLDGVEGADILLAEANHDEDWVRSGPYPYPLKRRVLGDRGHLSNEAGAELILRAFRSGTRTAVLAHLSAENNSPAHALETVSACLSRAGVEAGRDLVLEAAPRDCLSRAYVKEECLC